MNDKIVLFVNTTCYYLILCLSFLSYDYMLLSINKLILITICY